MSKEVRETAALLNQIITEIEANMIAAVQVTDTDEAFRLQSLQRKCEKGLRKELMQLAELEGTRAVFKCGAYEVLKLLATSIEELFKVFEEELAMKKAMVMTMWTVLRPMLPHGKLDKAGNQASGGGLKHGASRPAQ